MAEHDWFYRFGSMQKEMERLFEHLATAKPPAMHFSRCPVEPAVDLYETDDSLVVLLELAGVREEDVEISVDRTTLVVRGERRAPSHGVRRTYHQMEICCGSFERGLLLPVAVEPKDTRAVYKDGFLEITIPKVREEHTHHIPIETS